MTYARALRTTSGLLPSIPSLWEVAKAMYQRFLGQIQSLQIQQPSAIARHKNLSRSERREVLSWLEPIEGIVRHLLFAQALAHLLMTPEGRKLRQDHAPPPPPPPPGTTRSIRIPYPGWHTIWRPPVKPPAPPPPPPPKPPLDLSDPSSWPCSFKIEKQNAEPAMAAARRSMPLACRRPERIHAGEGEARPASNRSALLLARRIEALRRVIARPRPHMLRLARWLASRRAETIALRPLGATLRGHWSHGYDVWEQSRDHALLSLRAFHRTLEPG